MNRLVFAATRRRIDQVFGLEHLLPEKDPFILVANHSTRREAVILPALALLVRGGKPLHFLADWNFRLIPGVGFFYRRAGVITVTRKHAKPRILDVLRSRFKDRKGPLRLANEILMAQGSVGIFPEGTTNRAPGSLLPGHLGAARLSLAGKVPVVPVGIRFAGHENAVRPPLSARLSMKIGEAMHPQSCDRRDNRHAVRAWHAEIMQEIARLSGRQWLADQGAHAALDKQPEVRS